MNRTAKSFNCNGVHIQIVGTNGYALGNNFTSSRYKSTNNGTSGGCCHNCCRYCARGNRCGAPVFGINNITGIQIACVNPAFILDLERVCLGTLNHLAVNIEMD